MKKTQHSERRSTKRIKANFDAEITLSTGPLQVRGADIHKTGLRVISRQPLLEESIVFIRIKSLSLLGFAHVRHCTPSGALNYSIGLEFQSEPMHEEPGTWCYERISSASPLRQD